VNHAFVTIIADVPVKDIAALRASIEALGNPAIPDVAKVLDGLGVIHFSSLNVFEASAGDRGYLVFEFSADGDTNELLRLLDQKLGAELGPIFAHAKGRGDAPLFEFWHEHIIEVGQTPFTNPGVNFTGTPVVQIFQIHRSNSKDSLFYLLVGILFYFALTRVFFEKYFNNLLTLFFRVSLRQQQIREQVLQTPLPSLLLNILFIISGGLYACFLLHYSQIGASIRFWVLYLYCMLLLGAIYLVKFLVLKFIGWVFSISRATDIYVFIVFLVNKMLGIFLLPFLIMITFSGPGIREIFITISLAMVFVLWSYRVLAAYRPIRNEIKLTPFYFFLYLCAFEIAPLLLIYKVLFTYLEKVY